MAKGSGDLAIFKQEDAWHLLRIFFNQANSILEHCALEPAFPDGWVEKVEIRIGARQAECGQLIERRRRIADSLDVCEVVIVKVRFCALRRAEMDKDGAHAFGLDLSADLGDAVQSLRTKGAGEMAKKDEQDGRLVHQFQKRSA